MRKASFTGILRLVLLLAAAAPMLALAACLDAEPSASASAATTAEPPSLVDVPAIKVGVADLEIGRAHV